MNLLVAAALVALPVHCPPTPAPSYCVVRALHVGVEKCGPTDALSGPTTTWNPPAPAKHKPKPPRSRHGHR
jgi:hypothetical protein